MGVLRKLRRVTGSIILLAGIGGAATIVGDEQQGLETNAAFCSPCLSEAAQLAQAENILAAAQEARDLAQEAFDNDPSQQNAWALAQAEIALQAACVAHALAELAFRECLENLGPEAVLQNTVSILESATE